MDLFKSVAHYLKNTDLYLAVIAFICSGYGMALIYSATLNPGRHEPGTGEINYTKVLAHLEKCGYTGRVGYELFPETDTATAVKAIMEHSPKA